MFMPGRRSMEIASGWRVCGERGRVGQSYMAFLLYLGFQLGLRAIPVTLVCLFFSIPISELFHLFYFFMLILFSLFVLLKQTCTHTHNLIRDNLFKESSFCFKDFAYFINLCFIFSLDLLWIFVWLLFYFLVLRYFIHVSCHYHSDFFKNPYIWK